MIWLGLGLLVAAGAAFYLEVYFYEGVHLGPGIQGQLYDQWAVQYDLDKQESQASDAQFLVEPLLASWQREAGGLPDPLVLDVATGTGRRPLTGVMRCPSCDQVALARLPGAGLHSRVCGTDLPAGEQGVILYSGNGSRS